MVVYTRDASFQASMLAARLAGVALPGPEENGGDDAPRVPGVDTPGCTISPHPGPGTCDTLAGVAVSGVITPGYGLFVREITARNNPFHQPFIGHSAHPPVIIREFPAVPIPGRGRLDALGYRRPCAARPCRGN
jgi:hypothetical protein